MVLQICEVEGLEVSNRELFMVELLMMFEFVCGYGFAGGFVRPEQALCCACCECHDCKCKQGESCERK